MLAGGSRDLHQRAPDVLLDGGAPPAALLLEQSRDERAERARARRTAGASARAGSSSSAIASAVGGRWQGSSDSARRQIRAERRRRVGSRRWRRQIAGADAGPDLRVADPFPHPLARQRLPEDHARRVDVRAPIEEVPPNLLGGHVANLPLDGPHLRLDERSIELGDPEVEHLGLTLDGHEQVVRGDVAVNDAQRSPLEITKLVGGVQPA